MTVYPREPLCLLTNSRSQRNKKVGNRAFVHPHPMLVHLL